MARSDPRRPTTRGRVLFSVYLVVASLLLLELAVRVHFARQIGPRVLAYGTPWSQNRLQEAAFDQQYAVELAAWEERESLRDTVYSQENARGGYRKFFPNEAKYHYDIDTGEWFPVEINSRGLRGREFSDAKDEGAIRVLTLGASSTFGFFNREDETYPAQLERMLNAGCAGGARFEVINFAIPRSVAEEIRGMFLFEGLDLDPDVVTFYEGRNDSDRLHPTDFVGGDEEGDAGSRTEWAWEAVSTRSLVARWIDLTLDTRARVPAEAALAHLESVASRTSREFLADLEDIRAVAEERAILFIVANQQANSKSWFGLPEASRLALRGVTYGDEAEAIRARLALGQSVSGYEFNFLVHARLMRDLEAWAREAGLPFVDVIELLDRERHHLVSYVHLDAYANRKIAGAFGREILSRFCPGTG